MARTSKTEEKKKRSPAETERRAVDVYRGAHAQPAFDLATEPWLPALVQGRVQYLGLRELLVRAHQIDDLAETDHFVLAGLRRLLEVLTLELVALSSFSDEQWEDRLDDGEGFRPDEVEALLDAEREHLYLWHPRTPFLQRLDLLSALTSVCGRDRSTSELIPHVPNDSSQAWFLKGGEVGADGLAPAETARYLAARWFYALGSNADRVATGSDTKPVGAHPGSAFGEGASRITHVWRVGSSLLTTLVGNLLREDVSDTRGGSVLPAWRAGPHATTSLFLRSAPGMASLLGPIEGDRIAHMLRAPLPVSKDSVKTWIDQARDEDPHRVVVTTRKGPKVVRMSARESRLQSLHRVYREVVVNDGRMRRVLDAADLWMPRAAEGARLELFIVDKGGTGSSPTVEHTVRLLLDAPLVKPGSDQFDRACHYIGEALGFVEKDRGVRGRLECAMRGAFGDVIFEERGPVLKEPSWDSAAGRAGRALASREVPRWLELVEQLVFETDPGPSTTRDDIVASLYRLARDVYDDATTPYVRSARYAGAVALARQKHLWPPQQKEHQP